MATIVPVNGLNAAEHRGAQLGRLWATEHRSGRPPASFANMARACPTLASEDAQCDREKTDRVRGHRPGPRYCHAQPIRVGIDQGLYRSPTSSRAGLFGVKSTASTTGTARLQHAAEMVAR